MTAKEMVNIIGKQGMLKVDSLQVPVMVEDCRKVWQRVDVEVKPIGGKGIQWVSLDRVIIA